MKPVKWTPPSLVVVIVSKPFATATASGVFCAARRAPACAVHFDVSSAVPSNSSCQTRR
jgi:hypothetical protein